MKERRKGMRNKKKRKKWDKNKKWKMEENYRSEILGKWKNKEDERNGNIRNRGILGI